ELSFNDFVQMAQQLWRADLAAVITARIDASDDFRNDVGLATWAASVPSDAVRSALARHWQRLWLEEADFPESSSLFSSGARDPGLLVVLKQLPREAPVAKTHPSSKTNSKSSDTPAAQRVSNEQAAKQAWLRNSELFVRSLIDRLSKA